MARPAAVVRRADVALREVVLDTETTGLDPSEGHRVIEIGCIELVNRIPSGSTYQTYLNPEREIGEGAFEVHGLSGAFLRDKPLFADVADAFLGFLGSDRLIVHNAPFDIGFLNAELGRVGREPIGLERTVDTVLLARRRFPGQPANLDALCKRFNIDNSKRTKHGALLDAELLAEVYLELSGGRQADLSLVIDGGGAAGTRPGFAGGAVRPPRPHAPEPEELAAHAAFVAALKDPVWNR